MYCILVAGAPAAGKSTMAKAIAEKWSLPVISKDSIKEFLYDHIGFQSRAEKVNLGIASMAIMYYFAGQLMKAGQPFILENNFEYSSECELKDLLAKYQYPALTITLTGDYKAIYQRFLERDVSPDRHRGHVVNDCYPEKREHSPEEIRAAAISYEDFVHSVAQRGFDAFSASGEWIKIDTTDFSKIDMEELFSQISVWKETIMQRKNSMLQRITKSTWEKYIDYAYELALQPAKTSYPVYYDGIKTREDFVRRTEKAFSIEGEEILLYMEEDKVCGWIHYYYLKEDNYLSTVSMVFSDHMEQGLEEFLAYASSKYPDSEIWLGFPEENQQALSYLAEKGFELLEESYNDVLFLDNYREGENTEGIVQVTEENFPLFAQLHSQFDSDMYWNSERLRQSLEQWMIYLYEKKNVLQGAIYCIKGELAEIFGVDYADGVYSPEVFCALTEAVLNACKARQVKHLVFFNDEESQADALACGFSCVGKYVLMVRRQRGETETKKSV